MPYSVFLILTFFVKNFYHVLLGLGEQLADLLLLCINSKCKIILVNKKEEKARPENRTSNKGNKDSNKNTKTSKQDGKNTTNITENTKAKIMSQTEEDLGKVVEAEPGESSTSSCERDKKVLNTWYQDMKWVRAVKKGELKIEEEEVEKIEAQVHIEPREKVQSDIKEGAGVYEMLKEIRDKVNSIDKDLKQKKNETDENKLVDSILQLESEHAKIRAKELEKEKEEKNNKIKSQELKIRDLEREKECKICMSSDVSVVFLPCGHAACCYECGESLSYCPICRRKIASKSPFFT